MSNNETPDLTSAINAFANIWSDSLVIANFARHLTWTEMDALADLLAAAGRHEAAAAWREWHKDLSPEDEEGQE